MCIYQEHNEAMQYVKSARTQSVHGTMQQYRVQYAQAKKQMTVSNEATRSENQATMCTGESSES